MMRGFGFFVAGLFFGLPCAAAAKDMTFDIIYQNHTNVVVADGVITADTPDAFRAFLASEPFDGFDFLIDLNSPGGNLWGGMELGRMIRAEGLTARVMAYPPRISSEGSWNPSEEPGMCMSACALAFLGGEDRKVENGLLGFHQFSSAVNAQGEVADLYETETITQVLSGRVHEYIEEMGVSATLFSKMSRTLPEEMYLPNTQEREELKIVTYSYFRDFVMEPQAGGVIARASNPRNAEGRNVVSGITAYCEEGTPFLRLSQPAHYRTINLDWIRQSEEYLRGFTLRANRSVQFVEYPVSHVRLLSGGPDVADIRLDQRGVDMLVSGATGVVEMPAAGGRSMYFEMKPTEADRNILDGAFRLCVDASKSLPKAAPTEVIEGYRDFVGDYSIYLAAWSDPNAQALRQLDRLYADSVTFYGKEISRAALMEEKRAFAERWPVRNYSARRSTFESSCGSDVCAVSATIDWRADSPARGKSATGEAWYELTFDKATGRIIAEDGRSTRN